MSTEAQIAANRVNSQLSTGPKTGAGKARSCVNAVKSGLTGRTVLLPSDDLEAYRKLLDNVTAQYKPFTPEEKLLTQKIVDTEWRLLRIPELICGLISLGIQQLDAQFAEELAGVEEPIRSHMITTRVHLHYEKQLRNLALQEVRLRRQRKSDIAELEALTSTRSEQETSAAGRAVGLHRADPNTYTRTYFLENGFEFPDHVWRDALVESALFEENQKRVPAHVRSSRDALEQTIRFRRQAEAGMKDHQPIYQAAKQAVSNRFTHSSEVLPSSQAA